MNIRFITSKFILFFTLFFGIFCLSVQMEESLEDVSHSHNQDHNQNTEEAFDAEIEPESDSSDLSLKLLYVIGQALNKWKESLVSETKIIIPSLFLRFLSFPHFSFEQEKSYLFSTDTAPPYQASYIV